MAKFQFGGGSGRGSKTENTQSAKKWLNFNFFLGGGGVRFQTENTQSAKEWLNFNFQGGRGVGCQNWKYSKCQEMAKFQYLEGGGSTKLKILKVQRNG